MAKVYRVDSDGKFIGYAEVQHPQMYISAPGWVVDAPPDGPLLSGHEWHWSGSAWESRTPFGLESPAVTLAEVADSARKRVEGERERRIASGINYSFGGTLDRIQTRAIDQRNLTDVRGVAITLVLQGVTSAVIPFRAESNTDYMLTPTQALEMCAAVSQHGTGCYQWAWGVKAQIDAAATPQQIANILTAEGIGA